jgi:hypothetical protein
VSVKPWQFQSASTVVTYNFDDLLELYLEWRGFVVDSISEDIHWSNTADVRIYHPHGLLPLDPRRRKISKYVVFDRNSFDASRGSDGRLWRELIGVLLRTHSCIFIGLSGADANLTSALNEAWKYHIARNENLPFMGIRFTDNTGDAHTSVWEAGGVHTVVLDYPELPSYLYKLCQKAAMGEEI